MKRSLFRSLVLAGAGLGLMAGTAAAQDTIKIGGLATLEGAFAVLGQDGQRGMEMALKEHNNMAGGKKIEFTMGSSNASPDSAVNAARKLVEQDGVQILVGPLSGSEGLAVKDYAKTQPDVTFVNGSSAAQDTTLREPAPNFFRFNTDGAQWMAGLGEYAYKNRGYKNIVTVAEDYSFPYTQVFGFLLDYCKLGGKVADRFWVPIGAKDYSSIIASIPDDVDAIYVALGGADATNFLTQYTEQGGDKPIIGGSITVDQTVLGSKGRVQDIVVGAIAAGPIADTWDDPTWKAWVKEYQEMFPDGLPSPSLFAHAYYIAMDAVLTALDEVNGDLSGGQAKFREALANLKLDTPTGEVTLDQNRQAVADIFLTEVVKGPDGGLANKVIEVIPHVNQTLGMERQAFLDLGPVGRDNPKCQ